MPQYTRKDKLYAERVKNRGHDRICQRPGCGRYCWPNYFFCPSDKCHAAVSKAHNATGEFVGVDGFLWHG